MIDTTWRIEPEPDDPQVGGPPRPLLTTWTVLVDALRRGWLRWVGLAVCGGVLALAALVLRPPGGEATTTILLVHPTSSDTSAIGTDVSLLETRTVAARVIGELGLEISPEGLLSTVTTEPLTSQILRVTVEAPTESAAVERVGSLVRNFLEFRSAQLQSLSDGLARGYERRVATLQAQLADVTREYEGLSAKEARDQARTTDLLTRRTQLSSQINEMQRAREDASFATDAAISSTHVVDAPSAVPHSRTRGRVLYLASGVILGAALGAGLVILQVLTSDTVRTRRDVARALAVPVRASVRTAGPPTGRLGRLRWRTSGAVASGVARLAGAARPGRRRHPGSRDHPGSRARDVAVLVGALETAVPPLRRRARRPSAEKATPPATTRPRRTPAALGLVALDDPVVAALVVDGLATRLAGEERHVLLVDLSETGVLPGAHDPHVRVFRPSGIPSLSRGLLGRTSPRPGAVIDPQEQDLLREAWDDADVVLVLAELDPGTDVENLASWVPRVVPLVTAGRSRAELLATITELVHAAGIEVPFALLTGCDRSDASAGLPEPQEPSHPRGDAEAASAR